MIPTTGQLYTYDTISSPHIAYYKMFLCCKEHRLSLPCQELGNDYSGPFQRSFLRPHGISQVELDEPFQVSPCLQDVVISCDHGKKNLVIKKSSESTKR